MSLPTPKMPLPGFRLIADNAGSYIDDVNNIRLSSKFTLTRNTSDPSASIDIPDSSILIALGNSGNTAGRLGIEVLIARTALAADASKSASWSAGAYRRLRYVLSLTAASTHTQVRATFTGTSGTLNSNGVYYAATAGSTQNPGTLLIGRNGQAMLTGYCQIETGYMRSIHYEISSPDTTYLGTPLFITGNGYDDDTTHDVTGITFTFTGGAATGYMELWGLP